MENNEQNLRLMLLDLLKSLKGDAASNIDENTPLFTSGLIDSLVLLQLSLWIEEHVGAYVDPARYDLAQEWKSVAGIASFVERIRADRASNE
jgi:acyl carrier protein